MIFRENVNGVWLPTSWGVPRHDDPEFPPEVMRQYTAGSRLDPGWFSTMTRGRRRVWYHWSGGFSWDMIPDFVGYGWSGYYCPATLPWRVDSPFSVDQHDCLSLSLDIWNRC